MEWQKPQITSYSEEDLMKKLQVKALSGSESSGGGGSNPPPPPHHHRWW